jgi:hypothetical protein
MRHVFSFVVGGLIACGGSTTGTFGDPPGSSTSSSGATSSSSGGSSSGDVSSCTTAPMGATRACVPGTAMANAPITIQVDKPTGCLGCGDTIPPCEVQIRGNVITLDANVQTCPVAHECPAICGLPGVTCKLPALAEGLFTVVIDGEPSRPSPRQLLIAAAGETSCKLPAPGDIPETTVGSYSAACNTAADCVAVVGGDVCAPCACPSIVIATSAKSQYDHDYRAASSHCASVGPLQGATCSPCVSRPLVCTKGITNSCGFQ